MPGPDRRVYIGNTSPDTHDFWVSGLYYGVGQVVRGSLSQVNIIFKVVAPIPDGGFAGTTEPVAFQTAVLGDLITDNVLTWQAVSAESSPVFYHISRFVPIWPTKESARAEGQVPKLDITVMNFDPAKPPGDPNYLLNNLATPLGGMEIVYYEHNASNPFAHKYLFTGKITNITQVGYPQGLSYQCTVEGYERDLNTYVSSIQFDSINHPNDKIRIHELIENSGAHGFDLPGVWDATTYVNGPFIDYTGVYTWAPSTIVPLNQIRKRLTGVTTLMYQVTSIGTTTHQTGTTEPTWPSILGNTVVDGDITWTAVAIQTFPSLFTRKSVFDILTTLIKDPGPTTGDGYPVAHRRWFISGAWETPNSTDLMSGAETVSNNRVTRFVNVYSGQTIEEAALPLTDRPDGVVNFAKDSFARSELGPAQMGYADSGHQWYSIQGVWGLDNVHAQAMLSSSHGTGNVTIVRTSISDADIRVTFAKVLQDQGLAFRVSTAGMTGEQWSGLILAANTTFYTLWRRNVDQTYTALVSFGSTPADGDHIKVVLSGSTIKSYVNNVLLNTSTSTFNQTSTWHGLTVRSFGVARWDDFYVIGQGAVYYNWTRTLDYTGMVNAVTIIGPLSDPAPVDWGTTTNVAASAGRLAKDIPQIWQKDHLYDTLNTVIRSETNNTNKVYRLTSVGKSGHIEPTWPTTEGSSITESGVVFPDVPAVWIVDTWYSFADSKQQLNADGGEVTFTLEQNNLVTDSFNRQPNALVLGKTDTSNDWSLWSVTSTWQPNADVRIGDVRIPRTTVTSLFYVAETAGRTGTGPDEPGWPTTVGVLTIETGGTHVHWRSIDVNTRWGIRNPIAGDITSGVAYPIYGTVRSLAVVDSKTSNGVVQCEFQKNGGVRGVTALPDGMQLIFRGRDIANYMYVQALSTGYSVVKVVTREDYPIWQKDTVYNLYDIVRRTNGDMTYVLQVNYVGGRSNNINEPTWNWVPGGNTTESTGLAWTTIAKPMVETIIGTYSTTPKHGDLLKVNMADDEIKFYLNETPRLTITESFNNGATNHGIGANFALSNSDAQYEGFFTWTSYSRRKIGLKFPLSTNIDFGIETYAHRDDSGGTFDRGVQVVENNIPIVSTQRSRLVGTSYKIEARTLVRGGQLTGYIAIRYFEKLSTDTAWPSIPFYTSIVQPLVNDTTPLVVRGQIYHFGGTLSNVQMRKFTSNTYTDQASVDKYGFFWAKAPITDDKLDTEFKRQARATGIFGKHAAALDTFTCSTLVPFNYGKKVLVNNANLGWTDELRVITQIQIARDTTKNRSKPEYQLTIGDSPYEYGDDEPIGWLQRASDIDTELPPIPVGFTFTGTGQDTCSTSWASFSWEQTHQDEQFIEIKLSSVGNQHEPGAFELPNPPGFTEVVYRFPASGSTATIFGLVPSMVYQARIQARDFSNNASGWSSPALEFTSYQAMSAPAPPTLLSILYNYFDVAIQQSRVRFHWNLSVSGRLEGYRLYVDVNGSGQTFNVAFDVQEVEVIMPPNVAFSSYVRAISDCLILSDPSNTVTGTSAGIPVPDPPTSVHVQNSGVDENGVGWVYLAWTHSAFSDHHLYNVFVYPTGSGSGNSYEISQRTQTQRIITVPGNVTYVYIDQLTVDREYGFQVSTTDSYNHTGLYSTPAVNYSVTNSPPAPPTSFAIADYGVDDRTTGYVHLTWDPPGSLPPPLNGYDLDYWQTGSSNHTTFRAAPGINTVYIRNLDLGVQWNFRIRTIYFGVIGTWSTALQQTINVPAPPAPTWNSPYFDATGIQKTGVAWAEASWLAASPVPAQYYIQWRLSVGGPSYWAQVPSSTLKYTIVGLSPGALYKVSLGSIDKYGIVGAPTSEVSLTVNTVDPSPTQFASFDWSGPEDNGAAGYIQTETAGTGVTNTTQSYKGKATFQLINTSVTGNNTWESRPFSVVTGRNYIFGSAAQFGATLTPIGVHLLYLVRWYDRSDALLGTVTTVYDVTTSSGAFTFGQVKATAPAGAVYAKHVFKLTTATSNGVVTAYVSSPEVTEEIQNITIGSGIDGAKLSAGSVADAAIASGIDGSKLSSGTVGNTQLASSGLDAGKLTVGTLPIARIGAGAIDSSKFANYAVLPGLVDTGTGLFENGSMEIPNSAGTFPAAYTAESGTVTWRDIDTVGGTAGDGKRYLRLGGTIGTHRFSGPLIAWAKGREQLVGTLKYNYSTATGVTSIAYGLACYNKSKVFLSRTGYTKPLDQTALAWTAGGAWIDQVGTLDPNTGIDAATVYVAPYVEIVTTSATPTLDIDMMQEMKGTGTTYTSAIQGMTGSGQSVGSIGFVSQDVIITPGTGGNANITGLIAALSGLTGSINSTQHGNLGPFLHLFTRATKSSAFTADATAKEYLVNAGLSGITANLPDAATFAGYDFIIIKTDTSGNKVTVDPNGTQTIDGMLTYLLLEQWSYVWVVSDASNWHVISQGGPIQTNDGSTWLGVPIPINIPFATNSGGNATNYTGTTLVSRFTPPTAENYKITKITWWVRPNTTNNGLNYWTLRLGHEGNTFGGSVDTDLNTSALTAGTATTVTGTPNITLDFSNTSNFDMFLEIRKDVGAPTSIDVWGVSLMVRRAY